MKINQCKNCKHYNPFFDSCDIYHEEVYLDEGDFEVRPVSIKSVRKLKLECEYEAKKD